MSCRFFCIFQMNNEINLGFVGQDMAPGKKMKIWNPTLLNHTKMSFYRKPHYFINCSVQYVYITEYCTVYSTLYCTVRTEQCTVNCLYLEHLLLPCLPQIIQVGDISLPPSSPSSIRSITSNSNVSPILNIKFRAVSFTDFTKHVVFMLVSLNFCTF